MVRVPGPTVKFFTQARVRSPGTVSKYTHPNTSGNVMSVPAQMRLAAPQESFRQAVAEDSLFALAYYRLASAAEYVILPDVAAEASEKALRHADRLSERDRALLEASVAFRRGDAEAADRLYRSILGRWPDDVQAWFDLGEVLFHYNYVRGDIPDESRVLGILRDRRARVSGLAAHLGGDVGVLLGELDQALEVVDVGVGRDDRAENDGGRADQGPTIRPVPFPPDFLWGVATSAATTPGAARHVSSQTTPSSSANELSPWPSSPGSSSQRKLYSAPFARCSSVNETPKS